MVAEGDLGGHRHGSGIGRPPTAVERVGEHDPLAGFHDHEARIQVRAEGDAVVAHRRDERASGHDVEMVDPTVRRSRQPPAGEVERVGPRLPHAGARGTDHAIDPQVEVRVEVEGHDGSCGSVTNCSRRSVRRSHTARCSASQPSTTPQARAVERAGAHTSGLRGADQSAALERVDVLHERRQRHRRRLRELAHAGGSPCPTPTTARRVGSASAANTSSSDAEYFAIRLSIVCQERECKTGTT